MDPEVRAFDPYRRPVGPAAQAVVAEVRAILEAAESRQRRRQPANEARYALILDALIADLMRRSQEDDGTGWLLISRSKQELGRRGNRYATSPVMTEMLITVQDQLVAAGLAELDKGEATERAAGRRRSRIRAAPRLLDLADRHRVTLGDIGRADDEREETIHLRSEKGPRGEWSALDYTDTAETTALRADVLRLNQLFRAAALTLDADALEPGRTYDLSDRFAYRVFNNGRFDEGGRLFGPFWQTMRREDRAALRIDGEPVAVVDYGQMALRLAYAREGIAPPPGDLYAIPDLAEVPRDAVKTLVAAMISARRPLSRFPKTCRERGFPAAMTAAAATTAVRRHHAPIAGVFGSGIGFKLLRTESDIIVAVVLRLAGEGVTALPIHDAVVVRRSQAEQARRAMEDAFVNRTGFAAAVAVEDTRPGRGADRLDSL